MASASSFNVARVNHDHCGACGDGGKLLCCEGCPESFHLSCLDPPLDAVPDEEWFCDACLFRLSGPAPPRDSSPRALFLPLAGSNPTTFYLTPDLISDVTFEGDWIPGTRAGLPMQQTFHNNKCALCEESVSAEDHVGCSACTKAYHLHCLSPPLLAVPQVPWYCSQHKEHIAVPLEALIVPDVRIPLNFLPPNVSSNSVSNGHKRKQSLPRRAASPCEDDLDDAIASTLVSLHQAAGVSDAKASIASAAREVRTPVPSHPVNGMQAHEQEAHKLLLSRAMSDAASPVPGKEHALAFTVPTTDQLVNITPSTMHQLHPLFVQFLAWQRLMQINQGLGEEVRGDAVARKKETKQDDGPDVTAGEDMAFPAPVGAFQVTPVQRKRRTRSTSSSRGVGKAVVDGNQAPVKKARKKKAPPTTQSKDSVVKSSDDSSGSGSGSGSGSSSGSSSGSGSGGGDGGNGKKQKKKALPAKAESGPDSTPPAVLSGPVEELTMMMRSEGWEADSSASSRALAAGASVSAAGLAAAKAIVAAHSPWLTLPEDCGASTPKCRLHGNISASCAVDRTFERGDVITFGRRLTHQAPDDPEVPSVDMAESARPMSVSRHHAELRWHEPYQLWILIVFGRNGVKLLLPDAKEGDDQGGSEESRDEEGIRLSTVAGPVVVPMPAKCCIEIAATKFEWEALQ